MRGRSCSERSEDERPRAGPVTSSANARAFSTEERRGAGLPARAFRLLSDDMRPFIDVTEGRRAAALIDSPGEPVREGDRSLGWDKDLRRWCVGS
jgi:hypothetical protein